MRRERHQKLQYNNNNKLFSIFCSPKSPPNTPNPELASSLEEELKAVYINHLNKPDVAVDENGLSASDIIWDWSSQPNIPCK